jgi:hypothetical protein
MNYRTINHPQCCHVLRDRSSAFLVASPTFRPHRDSAFFTVSFVPACAPNKQPIEKNSQKQAAPDSRK